MSVGKTDYLSRLQILLVFLILNGMAKRKLAILPFLCCGEIMKNRMLTECSTQLSGFVKHREMSCQQRPLFVTNKLLTYAMNYKVIHKNLVYKRDSISK